MSTSFDIFHVLITLNCKSAKTATLANKAKDKLLYTFLLGELAVQTEICFKSKKLYHPILL